MYINRQLEKEILPFVKRKEAIAIIGPRQAGKTTFISWLSDKLIKGKKKVKFITFENRSDLNLFQNNIENFKNIAEQYDFVFIDEFQYAKNAGQKLKYLYDTTKVKYIISGSSSLELTFQTGKYMVGRMIDFPLCPFSFREFLSTKNKELYHLLQNNEHCDPITFKIKDGFGQEINAKLNKELEEYTIYGGYPAVVLSKTLQEKQKILQSIEEKYLLKDIKSLLKLTTDDELICLEKLLAGQIGNIIKYDELSNACGLNYKELKKHLNILEKTYLVNFVKPFFTNRRTELVKNPKVYFVDTGLRNFSLVDFRSFNNRQDVGALMENYGYNLLKTINPQIRIKYWRTKSKAEVDFILEKNQKIYPIEIKYVSKKIIGKSLYSFIDKFKPEVAIILTKDFLHEEKIANTKIKFIPLSYF